MSGRRLFAGFALALFAAPAGAEPAAGLDLDWSVPPGCPEKAEVLREIERLLGGERALHDGAPLRALGAIRLEAGRFRLELRFPSASSELTRYVESESCGELDEAAALILALSLDPNNPRLAAAALPASVSTGSSATGTEPAAQEAENPPSSAAIPAGEPREIAKPGRTTRPAAREPTPLTREPPSAPVRFAGPPQVGARAALELGTLPAAAFGGLLDVAVAAEPVLFRAEAALYVPQTVSVPSLEGARGFFRYGALALQPCFRFSSGRVSVSPCASLEAAFVFARGEGVERPEHPFVWFPRLGAGADLGYTLVPRLALAAGISASLQPARPTFVLEGTELFRPALFGLRISAGLKLAL